MFLKEPLQTRLQHCRNMPASNQPSVFLFFFFLISLQIPEVSNRLSFICQLSVQTCHHTKHSQNSAILFSHLAVLPHSHSCRRGRCRRCAVKYDVELQYSNGWRRFLARSCDVVPDELCLSLIYECQKFMTFFKKGVTVFQRFISRNLTANFCNLPTENKDVLKEINSFPCSDTLTIAALPDCCQHVQN